MAGDFGRRFDQLLKQADEIESKKTRGNIEYGGGNSWYLDQNEMLNWHVKTRHLISSVCGEDSHHFKLFVENEKSAFMDTNHTVLMRLRAVLIAAKDDYEGGYLHKIRN